MHEWKYRNKTCSLLHFSSLTVCRKGKHLDSKELTPSMIVSATSLHAHNFPTLAFSFSSVYIEFTSKHLHENVKCFRFQTLERMETSTFETTNKKSPKNFVSSSNLPSRRWNENISIGSIWFNLKYHTWWTSNRRYPSNSRQLKQHNFFVFWC